MVQKQTITYMDTHPYAYEHLRETKQANLETGGALQSPCSRRACNLPLKEHHQKAWKKPEKWEHLCQV
jgi:hypothetical protein